MHERENPYLGLNGFGAGADRRRGCDHPGCKEEGQFRAPRSRDQLRDYFWFCLDHVRAYNAAWNYFADMSEDEIDRYRRDDAGWHRQTWPLNGKSGDIHVGDPLEVFAGLDGGRRFAERARPDGQPLTPEDRKALGRLGLDERATRNDIKRTYKQLVKRYHPDSNGGNRAGEGKFRTISDAYRHLSAHWPDA